MGLTGSNSGLFRVPGFIDKTWAFLLYKVPQSFWITNIGNKQTSLKDFNMGNNMIMLFIFSEL